MKTHLSIPRYFLLFFIIVTLVFLSTALISPAQQTQDPPPPDNPDLEVGSTNGITLLAFIISAVIVLPLLTHGALHRKENPPQA